MIQGNSPWFSVSLLSPTLLSSVFGLGSNMVLCFGLQAECDVTKGEPGFSISPVV